MKSLGIATIISFTCLLLVTTKSFANLKTETSEVLASNQEVSNHEGIQALDSFLAQFESTLEKEPDNVNFLLSMLEQAKLELANQTSGHPYLYLVGEYEIKNFEEALQRNKKINDNDLMNIKSRFKLDKLALNKLFH